MRDRPPTSASRPTAARDRAEAHDAAQQRAQGPRRGDPHRHVLGAGHLLLRLRRDDRRPDRRALHPRRARPRHAGHHRRRRCSRRWASSTSRARPRRGWLTDRTDPRILLFWYYALRGVSLVLLSNALTTQSYTLVLFVAFYGLDWIATVPPTVALAARRFGPEKAGIVFGWVFTFHQLGGAAAAFAPGACAPGTATTCRCSSPPASSAGSPRSSCCGSRARRAGRRPCRPPRPPRRKLPACPKRSTSWTRGCC